MTSTDCRYVELQKAKAQIRKSAVTVCHGVNQTEMCSRHLVLVSGTTTKHKALRPQDKNCSVAPLNFKNSVLSAVMKTCP